MSLQAAFDDTAKAASAQAAEGQKLFNDIASFLDKHLDQFSNFLLYFLSALNALRINITIIGQ
ncbi:hypothetical protein BDZ45DRAFT_600034 [Acephala macrosclerotiorum]|nr:hypothetical protein BDZ45DRAFT_600034 [Acephala macrosclerotiorum]